MTSSVVKSDQTVQERMFQEFPGIPHVVHVIGRSESGHSFFPTEYWGEPSRLDTEAVPESVRKLLGRTVVSKSEPAPDDVHSARFYEIAAEMDQYARGLLWKISDCTFIPGPEVVEFAGDYDALRAIVLTVRAGWVKAAPGGLLVTQHGRGVAGWMFVDR